MKTTQKTYTLHDEKNQPFESDIKGTIGGHKKLKIYGKLDCPSALRYLKKGHYKTQRVFFLNEKTAMQAGYRPCGVCMKEKYMRIMKKARH